MIKKKIIFLENDIGFEIKIGLNLSKDKNRTETHAIQSSLKSPSRFAEVMAKGV